jgi:DNA-binding MarR family transcriptional regulator
MSAVAKQPPASRSPGASKESGDDEMAVLATRLRMTIGRLNRLLRQQADLDLTPTKFAHLATIAREGPLSLGELAAAEQVAPATVTKVVADLEERGFVTRERDPDDRRVSRVQLTREGEARIAASRTRRSVWLAQRFDELPAADLQRLAAAVDVLERLAEADRDRR